MSAESITSVAGSASSVFPFGHRPNVSVAQGVGSTPVHFTFGHRPRFGFLPAPTPPVGPSYTEGFLMSAVRGTGARVTWVSAGAPDLTGASAPSGAAIVLSSITILKRGFNAA